MNEYSLAKVQKNIIFASQKLYIPRYCRRTINELNIWQ